MCRLGAQHPLSNHNNTNPDGCTPPATAPCKWRSVSGSAIVYATRWSTARASSVFVVVSRKRTLPSASQPRKLRSLSPTNFCDALPSSATTSTPPGFAHTAACRPSGEKRAPERVLTADPAMLQRFPDAPTRERVPLGDDGPSGVYASNPDESGSHRTGLAAPSSFTISRSSATSDGATGGRIS